MLGTDDVGVLAAGVHLGPPLDLVPVLARQPHQLAHDLARQQRGDVVHEVDLAGFPRVAMISRQMVRMRPSSPPITRALKLGASGRR